MAGISQQEFRGFYEQQRSQQRYAAYAQDFDALASDDSLELDELKTVLASDAPYDKKRIAFELVQKFFPNDGAKLAAPIPTVWDTASTALLQAADHYTLPWQNAAAAALTDYNQSKSLASAAWSFAASPHYGVSNLVNYVNPFQAGSEAADSVMKQNFEAGNRASATYVGAAATRFALDVPSIIANGVGSMADLPLYAAAVGPAAGMTIVKDAVSAKADDVTWDKDYYPALTKDCPFWDGAYGAAATLGHLLRLDAKLPVAGIVAGVNAYNRTDDSSFAKSVVENYWDFVGNDVAPLIGLDVNDPDYISRGLRVGSTAVAIAAPVTKTGRSIMSKAVPEGVAEGVSEWATRDQLPSAGKIFSEAKKIVGVGEEARAIAETKAAVESAKYSTAENADRAQLHKNSAASATASTEQFVNRAWQEGGRGLNFEKAKAFAAQARTAANAAQRAAHDAAYYAEAAQDWKTPETAVMAKEAKISAANAKALAQEAGRLADLAEEYIADLAESFPVQKLTPAEKLLAEALADEELLDAVLKDGEGLGDEAAWERVAPRVQELADPMRKSFPSTSKNAIVNQILLEDSMYEALERVTLQGTGLARSSALRKIISEIKTEVGQDGTVTFNLEGVQDLTATQKEQFLKRIGPEIEKTINNVALDGNVQMTCSSRVARNPILLDDLVRETLQAGLDLFDLELPKTSGLMLEKLGISFADGGIMFQINLDALKLSPEIQNALAYYFQDHFPVI